MTHDDVTTPPLPFQVVGYVELDGVRWYLGSLAMQTRWYPDFLIDVHDGSHRAAWEASEDHGVPHEQLERLVAAWLHPHLFGGSRG